MLQIQPHSKQGLSEMQKQEQQHIQESESIQLKASKEIEISVLKEPQMGRKLSKRRELQEDRQTVLQLFKEMIAQVNQNYNKAVMIFKAKNRVPKLPKPLKIKAKSRLPKQSQTEPRQNPKKKNEEDKAKEKSKISIKQENLQKNQQIEHDRAMQKQKIFENYSVLMTYHIEEPELIQEKMGE